MEVDARSLIRSSGEGVRRAWASRPSLRAFALLWIPAAIAAVAILLPIAYLLLRVFSGKESVWALLLRPAHLEILARTAWLAFWVTLLSLAIALPIAWLTVRTDLPLRRLWMLLTPLPLVIPSYVGAYLLASALGPRGLLQGWLEGVAGITRLPSIYGFPGALLALTLLNYPLMQLSLQAALQRLDPSLEEASRSLGHGAWQTFWKVIVPQLRPSIGAGSILILLYVLRDFGAVSVMRYTTFTRAIYLQYQSFFDRSSAAALATIVVLLSLILVAAENRARGRLRYYGGNKSAKPAIRQQLGLWRLPALIFIAAVVLAALIIPASVLLFWLLRGLSAGESLSTIWGAAFNSILSSALAATGALILALAVAVLDVRKPGFLSRLIERSTYLAYALPGIVIALALVFFGANYLPWIYQTLPMLVFAYVILFLPQAVGAIRGSLLQVHPHMEEAARGLGVNPLTVFRRITLPLMRPGVIAAFSLVFLTSMKELPATLFLAPLGFRTLATSVWSAVSEAFFARAAAPALLLILASSLSLGLVFGRSEEQR
ncbi:MAG TPA: iron ABC transporter permease [Anaerolineales bacterium]|nr:iron ABC transporter permease [Anaerolineales bacterium]